MRPRVEIAVQDVAGAQTAMEKGADRIELCTALALGGLTPSLATIEQSVSVGIAVHVLIRPRAGDYVYSPAETAVMVADIRHAVRAGAAGVVVGALTDGDQALDTGALQVLIAAARDENPSVEITVHRCVDVLIENGFPVRDLIDSLRALGADRILTSGGAEISRHGADVLEQLRRYAAGKPQIQAGGGIAVKDVAALRGLDGIHLSAREERRGGRPGPGGGPGHYDVTSPEVVSAVITAVAHG